MGRANRFSAAEQIWRLIGVLVVERRRGEGSTLRSLVQCQRTIRKVGSVHRAFQEKIHLLFSNTELGKSIRICACKCIVPILN